MSGFIIIELHAASTVTAPAAASNRANFGRRIEELLVGIGKASRREAAGAD
ncbi:MAG: hypothetical protein ABI699_05475 [Caldimonas sp.]